jgi:hypothetical protein
MTTCTVESVIGYKAVDVLSYVIAGLNIYSRVATIPTDAAACLD